MPTLAIVTTEDPLIYPALQRQLAAGVPAPEVTELPTRHLPFAEQP
ncbi:alpha/beta fold hydrolase [Streptomyces fractus]